MRRILTHWKRGSQVRGYEESGISGTNILEKQQGLLLPLEMKILSMILYF